MQDFFHLIDISYNYSFTRAKNSSETNTLLNTSTNHQCEQQNKIRAFRFTNTLTCCFTDTYKTQTPVIYTRPIYAFFIQAIRDEG